MFKTYALLAATVSGHSKRDITSLHSSLEGMLSEVKATYHTDAAYKVAKRARDADVISLPATSSYSSSASAYYTDATAEAPSSEGFYNKYTDYYSAPCSGDYYEPPYQYEDMYKYNHKHLLRTFKTK